MGAFVFTKDRGLVIKRKRYLVVADLHIGFEYELFTSGISIPSQTRRILKRLENLIEEFKIKKLILLGDIKHNIPLPSKQEKYELPNFFKTLNELTELIIVKGNHDGNIEEYISSEVKIYGGEGFREGKYAFAHGHAWIGKDLCKAKVLFLGHEHPAIEFRDKYGRSVEPAWIITKPKSYSEECLIEKVVLLPSFNHLIGGIAFNKKDFEPHGPNAKNLDIENSDVYLSDGIYLGKLKDLTFYE